MERIDAPGARGRRELCEALRETEGVGDVLSFVQLAMDVQSGDLLLEHYPRRGLALLLGDCSRRVDRVCLLLDRILDREDARGSEADRAASMGRPARFRTAC